MPAPGGRLDPTSGRQAIWKNDLEFAGRVSISIDPNLPITELLEAAAQAGSFPPRAAPLPPHLCVRA